MSKTHFKNISAAFDDTGSGSAVVLLHGFLENRKMWREISEEIKDDHRVIAIDLLGHGETDALGYIQTMDDNAALVFHILSELNIEKAAFVGHSMGGYVALAFAEKHPKMVSGLALLNSTARADSEERRQNRDRAIAAVKQNYTAFVRMSIANLFSETNRERLSSEIEQVRREALKTPLQGIVASLEGMKVRKDTVKILDSLKVPKLLVLGEKDPVLGYDETISLVKPGVQLLSFADGHMSHIENTAELAKSLKEFLRQL